MQNRIFEYLHLRHFRLKSKTASPTTALKHCHVCRFAWGIATLGTLAFAQTPKTQFVPFQSFMESVRAADSVSLSARTDSATKDAAAIEEMRQSILKRYDGVQVSHSYVRDGMHFDCVPVNQQPAVRTYGLTSIAAPPPQELLKDSATAPDGITQTAAPQLSSEPVDEFGNSAVCEANTVPLERLTMEKLTRFPSLREFYQKSSHESAAWQKRTRLVAPDVDGHRYSVVYQHVNDLGGNTNINVWAPYVDTGLGEVFSLSQAWYVGGSGNNLQTEEVGWVVFPQMFNDENAHLFIYSTADGYNQTGCWNNSCGDFVQVTTDVGLGYSLLPVSTVLGPQYAPSFRYYLWYGNWWVAYNGTWVGYYPGAKYNGGQNSYFAQTIEYGTETVGSWYWPPAGSGFPANWGFGWGAFQLNVFYQGLDFATYPANLSILGVSSCYSIDGPYTNGGNGWNTFFYDGGWGGTGCT